MSRRLFWRSCSNRTFNVASRWNNVSILSGVQGFVNHKWGITSKLCNHFGINIMSKITLNHHTNRPHAQLTWIEQLSNQNQKYYIYNMLLIARDFGFKTTGASNTRFYGTKSQSRRPAVHFFPYYGWDKQYNSLCGNKIIAGRHTIRKTINHGNHKWYWNKYIQHFWGTI
jgi:hypothetical protein